MQATWTELLVLLRRQTGCRTLFDLRNSSGSGVCPLEMTFLQTGCRSCFFGLRFKPLGQDTSASPAAARAHFHDVFLHRPFQSTICDDVIRWRCMMMSDVMLHDDDVRSCYVRSSSFFVYDLRYLAWCYGVVGVEDTRYYYTSCPTAQQFQSPMFNRADIQPRWCQSIIILRRELSLPRSSLVNRNCYKHWRHKHWR